MKIETSLPGVDREAGRGRMSLAMTGVEMATPRSPGEGFCHEPHDKHF